MGVGGNFWDLLKPYARAEGFNFLRNKRVAVDLSYWIVQHETAIKSNTLNPHVRLTFFRTVNLFSKFGALPVFIVDGNPSPLKSQTRIARFFRGSGIDLLSLPVPKDGISVERNDKFLKSVQECIELLKLLGMPVLKSTGEAEALCAQLNKEGHVDACITADSDTFLFGADCVIKCLRPNSKEPFECYYMSDIEAGLGLKRKHLIGISLLVGNDYKLNGVQGIGPDTALRFVKSFSEDEILNRLHEIGRGDKIQFPSDSIGDFIPSSDANSQKAKFPHCSLRGHPRSKRSHLKFDCEFCSPSTTEGCIKKPMGFKYSCSSCDTERKQKELKKNENWQMKVCKKNSMEQNFPNDEIIGIYLSNNQGNFIDVGQLCWEDPNTEMLVDFLAYPQSWEPSYIRQMTLPMLSTIFLRKMALNSSNVLLHGQYMFDSIKRVKVRFVTGHSSTTISACLGMASHIIDDLIAILKEFKSNKTTGPVLIHVIIEKGRGYPYAEKAADKYHRVAKFDPAIGKQFKDNAKTQSYITYFMEALIAEAERDKGIVAIHVVMGGGITGLAHEGLKPFCAIYSSFLQRANDQIVHDVDLQKLPVRFAMDRAGLVGADGPTHSGSFDVTYMKKVLSNCSSFAKSLSERVYEVVFCSIDEAHVAGFTKDNGILLLSFGTTYVPIYALLPLGSINMECELVAPDDVLNQSKILKSVNIDWVMVDCWWGIVEAHTPQHSKCNGYKKHFQLKLQVMTFPECGGNVDDDVHIPLPQWIAEIGPGQWIFFMDRKGRCNSECLTWDVDKEERKDPYRYFKWTVTFGTTNLLGVPKQVILIYGQFPGPRLDVDTHDNIIINQQDEPFLLTWNGVKQRKVYWQDGVLGTNCPIPHLHFYPP